MSAMDADRAGGRLDCLRHVPRPLALARPSASRRARCWASDPRSRNTGNGRSQINRPAVPVRGEECDSQYRQRLSSSRMLPCHGEPRKRLRTSSYRRARPPDPASGFEPEEKISEGKDLVPAVAQTRHLEQEIAESVPQVAAEVAGLGDRVDSRLVAGMSRTLTGLDSTSPSRCAALSSSTSRRWLKFGGCKAEFVEEEGTSLAASIRPMRDSRAPVNAPCGGRRGATPPAYPG